MKHLKIHKHIFFKGITNVVLCNQASNVKTYFHTVSLEKPLYHVYQKKDFKGGTELIVTMYF